MVNQNNNNYKLEDQVMEIQNLAQKINENGKVNKEVVEHLFDRCQQLKMQLDQSKAFNNKFNDESLYNIHSNINNPLDDYTNLV